VVVVLQQRRDDFVLRLAAERPCADDRLDEIRRQVTSDVAGFYTLASGGSRPR